MKNDLNLFKGNKFTFYIDLRYISQASCQIFYIYYNNVMTHVRHMVNLKMIYKNATSVLILIILSPFIVYEV